MELSGYLLRSVKCVLEFLFFFLPINFINKHYTQSHNKAKNPKIEILIRWDKDKNLLRRLRRIIMCFPFRIYSLLAIAIFSLPI
jgi:hypothetical protein